MRAPYRGNTLLFDVGALSRLTIVLGIMVATVGAEAAVLMTFSPSTWQAQVAAPTTLLTFADIAPPGLPVIFTDQYASLGVVASQGDDIIKYLRSGGTDGWRLHGRDITVPGGDPSIELEFASPIGAIGFTANGGFQLDLFLRGLPVATDLSIGPFGPPWKFVGVVSDIQFDKAHLRPTGPGTGVIIDDLYFETIPAPAAAPLLLLAAYHCSRRRRSKCE